MMSSRIRVRTGVVCGLYETLMGLLFMLFEGARQDVLTVRFIG